MQANTKQQLQALMQRLAEGDRTAFAPAFELLWPVVQRFALRALAGSPDAEDAAQVALMKVFSHAARFDTQRDALSWALGITAYECKTYRKRQARRRETHADAASAHAIDAADPEQQAIARDLEQAALETLQSLGALDAETLRAVLDEHRPDVAPATFRKRVARALERLRAAWSTRHDLD